MINDIQDICYIQILYIYNTNLQNKIKNGQIKIQIRAQKLQSLFLYDTFNFIICSHGIIFQIIDQIFSSHPHSFTQGQLALYSQYDANEKAWSECRGSESIMQSLLLWEFLRILVIQSILNFYAGALYMNSIKFIPIGVVNALLNTIPVITFFLQISYYKKGKLNWINLLIIIISFCGVLLIIQPEFIFGSKSTIDASTSSTNIYYGMVLLAALFSSFSVIFIHDLSGKVHELVTLHYGYLFQGLCSCMMFQLFFGNSSQNANRFRNLPWLEIMSIVVYVILMVIFAFASHYLRAISFFMCQPAIVLPFNYITIIFGVFETKSYNFLIILGMVLSACGLFSKFLHLRFNLDDF